MIDQITKEIIAKKNAGAFKVRVVMFNTIDRDGKKIPQVFSIMECETAPAILKSGKLAKTLAKCCEGQYESFKVEVLK